MLPAIWKMNHQQDTLQNNNFHSTIMMLRHLKRLHNSFTRTLLNNRIFNHFLGQDASSNGHTGAKSQSLSLRNWKWKDNLPPWTPPRKGHKGWWWAAGKYQTKDIGWWDYVSPSNMQEFQVDHVHTQAVHARHYWREWVTNRKCT